VRVLVKMLVVHHKPRFRHCHQTYETLRVDAGQGYDPNDYPNYPYPPQDRPARDQWSRHWESNPHVEECRHASHMPQSRPWYPQPSPEPCWSPYSNSSQSRYPQSTPVTSPWWLPPYPPNTSPQAYSGPPFPFNPVNMSPEDWPPADMASAPVSHPLLHPAYSDPPTINWNMMVFPRSLHRFSQRGVEVTLTDKDMKKVASNPPTKKMRIGIADTPWAELSISKRKDITLKDVLEALWDHLNVPMTLGEYNLLEKSKQARVRVAYQARCQLGYFGLPEHERRSGFRRIDWFEGRCGFGGLEWAHINAVGEMCGTMRPRACPPPEA